MKSSGKRINSFYTTGYFIVILQVAVFGDSSSPQSTEMLRIVHLMSKSDTKPKPSRKNSRFAFSGIASLSF